jgi:putative FmdB family regulatory protein
MPIYEYTCNQCGHRFEEWQASMNADAKVQCTKCQSRDVERLVSVFAAQHAEPESVPLPSGGCGRCGDPNGPCGL